MPESRLWQLIGATSFAGGIVIGAIPALTRGLRPGDALMLSIDLAAAFICIAGSAGYLAGRVMQAVQVGGAASESGRLRVLGLVLVIAGVVPVLFAGIRSRITVIPTPNQIWLGSAGAALLLIGIFALLAYRLLEKAQSSASARGAKA